MRNGSNWNRTRRWLTAPIESSRIERTLRGTAWALIVLMHLTASISHGNDPDQASGSSATSKQELSGGPSVERYCPVSVGGERWFPASCPTLAPSKCNEYLYQSVDSEAPNDGNAEWTSCSNIILLCPNIIQTQESWKTIDALRYTEYGAGLLQKNGPTAEGLKICLVKGASGTRCQTLSRYEEFTGQKCPTLEILSCLEGFLPDVHCNDAISYEGDFVAGLESGEPHLVCRSDSLTGAVFCEMSKCFFSALESKLLQFDSSARGFISQSCPSDNGIDPIEASSTKPGMPFAVLHIGHLEASQFPCQSLEGSDIDGPPSIVERGSESSLVDGDEHQDGDTPGDKQDEVQVLINTNQISVIMPPQAGQCDHASQLSADVRVDEQSETIDNDESACSKPKSELHVEVGTHSDGDLESSHLNSQLPVDEHSKMIDNDESACSKPKSELQVEVGTQLDGDSEISHLNSQLEKTEIPERLKRVGSVMNLEEYRRSILEKQQMAAPRIDLSSVQSQKLRQSDRSYNYAAASYGAKVLASNKEAKGINHILVSDKDKYLRNLCSAEDKFVVIELSEETFVDTLVISNFEFHSSNLKDFELLGSSLYPTTEWISLGKFQAENMRDRQKFNIEDPVLVRYLMLKMLSHWGSEFFCTLSVVEVFGVDVIKNLLDDWIAMEEVESSVRMQGANGYVPSQVEHDGVKNGKSLEGDGVGTELEELLYEPKSDFSTGSDLGRGKAADKMHGDENIKVGSTGDPAQDILHVQGGKPPGDSVLKILMQRVKALELNQTLFDLYIGDMNKKYKAMLLELDKDLAMVSERLRNETALTASLAMQLTARELQRKTEQLYLEHQFALISSNFTDTLGYMRCQVQSLEKREIAAVVFAILCLILSACLHLVGCCIQRYVSKHEMSRQPVSKAMGGRMDIYSLRTVCNASSTFVLYLASGLTILVLSV